MHEILTFFGSIWQFKLHALWAGPLYSPVKWSCSWTFLSVDMNGLVQIEQLVALLYSLNCSWVSCFIGILLAMCCLQIAAAARTWSKNFSTVTYPLYSLEVVWSIVHHCISCRCSFHMVCVAGIRWGRILIMTVHISFVYVERFQNSRRWQKVNAVGILFL